MGRPVVPLEDDLAEAYLAHCVHEGTPVNTVKRRRTVLRSVGRPSTATREEVEDWWYDLARLSPSSRANALRCLRSFYRWCQVWDHRHDDPTLRITAPKVPNGLPRPLTRDDVLTILDHVRDEPDLRRAVCLGAYAGLRVSEAASLHWRDVDLEARRATVLGKGQKVRRVALSSLLIDQLLPDTGGNVVSGGDDQYSDGVLQRRVNRAIKRAGVEGTFHQLRHRYGTIAYQATKDLVAVGQAMGHASLVTTAVYAAAADDVADKIADAVVR